MAVVGPPPRVRWSLNVLNTEHRLLSQYYLSSGMGITFSNSKVCVSADFNEWLGNNMCIDAINN